MTTTASYLVVVVDDSPEDRDEVRRLLLQNPKRRYEFLEAVTGADGIARCRAAGRVPDCIVLDFTLPDMDAFDVLAALQARDGCTIAPVVILTGGVGHDSVRALVRAGAHDYQGKGWMTSESLSRGIDNAMERWAMSRELRAGQARLARAQHAAQIGTWEWNVVTGMASWTEEAWRLFGRVPFSSAVTFDLWLQSVLPEDRARAAAANAESLRTGRYRDEFRVRAQDGTIRWLESRGEALFDAAGKPSWMLGTVQDITERKRAEDKLREREQRLRLALRAGKTGVWEWEIASGRVEWTEETYAIFGLAPGTFAGTLEAFASMIHREDRDAVMRSVRAAIEANAEYASEFRIVRANGEIRRVTNLGVVQRDDGSEEPSSMVGTITDVTEQRAAEEALRDRERQLQLVANNMPDVLSRFDRQRRHVFVNAAVEQATGLPPEAFLGKTNRELGMPEELCLQWESALDSVFERGEPRSIDFSYPSPAGARHFESRIVPERGPSGAVEHVLSVVTDVTSRVEAANALRDADRRKDEFLATLAHELRNPLAPIRTGLQLLQMTREENTLVRTTQMMERQVTQMVRLIDDLLDVSRISSGKVVLRRERICLQDIVTAALEAARPALNVARHSVRLDQPDAPIWLDGDPTRLTQVIANLLTNAAKYTPDSGRVSLATRVEAGTAVISISDNGHGIPPEMLQRIFEMFTQVSRTLHRAQGGLGIGLALVKRLVEMHGGAVTVESAGEGQGSTFTVRIPAAIGDSQSKAATPQSGQLAAAPRRVLVVDDNLDAAESLAQVLELFGSEVRLTSNARDALNIAAQFVPELVFLDISMPGMSGYEAAQHLRQNPKLSRTTLVAISGWGSEEDRRRSREAGFDYHHTKPIDAQAMDALFRQCGQAVEES